jgi:Histidine kinase-, DNA gyrase B-, and HSP90-like ATPase
MNLFGNALKYTADGLITIRLDALDNVDKQNASVALSILDTGKGISNDYLENHLFTPFSQEDSFASGTGLGLSIVDQLVRSIGGKVDITSSKGVGTKVIVGVPLKTVDPSLSIVKSLDIVGPIAERIRGMRICILREPNAGVPETSASESAEREFSSGLSVLLKQWFGMKTAVETTWSADCADLVLCLKPSFKQLDSIRKSSGEAPVPSVIFIAYDALEMAVLQADARITGDNSVVEIISQP